jgi:hypothetical protein
MLKLMEELMVYKMAFNWNPEIGGFLGVDEFQVTITKDGRYKVHDPLRDVPNVYFTSPVLVVRHIDYAGR